MKHVVGNKSRINGISLFIISSLVLLAVVWQKRGKME